MAATAPPCRSQLAAPAHSRFVHAQRPAPVFQNQRCPHAHTATIHASHRLVQLQDRCTVQCRVEPDARASNAGDPGDAAATSQLQDADAASLGPRDDDVLPDSLTDAIAQASESTCTAMSSGQTRIVAEVLLGEFWDPSSGAVFAEEGDQQRFWKLTRRFAENLASTAGEGTALRVLYPDMGVAAMLKNQWGDATFAIGSIGDRTPFRDEDDIIVMAAPDPQSLAAAQRIAREAEDKTIVMFNPRLASGEVGIGLNVRRMVNEFLGSFAIAYSLRPIGDIGTVFRRYPNPWMVFIEDADIPGRYKLAAERDFRPAGEALDIIIQDALGQATPDEEPGFGQQIGRTIGSLQRFMNSLTR